jgi:hypothetical protein
MAMVSGFGCQRSCFLLLAAGFLLLADPEASNKKLVAGDQRPEAIRRQSPMRVYRESRIEQRTDPSIN